jgi:hypothetical protein
MLRRRRRGGWRGSWAGGRSANRWWRQRVCRRCPVRCCRCYRACMCSRMSRRHTHGFASETPKKEGGWAQGAWGWADGSTDKQLWWRYKGPQGNDTMRSVSWSPSRLCLVLRPRHPCGTAHPHTKSKHARMGQTILQQTHGHTASRQRRAGYGAEVGGLCAEPPPIAVQRGRLQKSCQAAQASRRGNEERSPAAAQGTTQRRGTEEGDRERLSRRTLPLVVLHPSRTAARGCGRFAALSRRSCNLELSFDGMLAGDRRSGLVCGRHMRLAMHHYWLPLSVPLCPCCGLDASGAVDAGDSRVPTRTQCGELS